MTRTPRTASVATPVALFLAILTLVATYASGVSGAAVALPAAAARPDTVPAALELIGQVGGSPRAVAIIGNTAYLAVGPRVWIVNVADPALPRVTGMSDVLPGEMRAIQAGGGRVVVVSEDPTNELRRRVLTVFLSDGDTGLRRVGEVVFGGSDVAALELDGTLVAVKDLLGALQFVDISDPAHPQLLDLAESPEYVRHTITAAVLEGAVGYVFVGRRGGPSGSLQVLDLTDAHRPRLMGRLEIGAFMAVLVGDNLYTVDTVGTSTDLALTLIDVGDPRRPRSVSTTRLPALRNGVGALAAAAGFVYVVGAFGELLAWDASDPTRPQLVANIASSGRVNAAVALDSHLFLALESAPVYVPNPSSAPSGLVLYDVSDPRATRETGRLAVMPGGVRDLAVVDGHVYATAYSHLDEAGALWAFDLADPTRPMPEAFVPLPVGGSGIAHNGRFLYVSGASGLHVIDITRPGRPRLRGVAPDVAFGGPIAAGAGYVYVATDSELYIVDVREPDLPQTVSRLPIDALVLDIADMDLAGGFLYIGAVYDGFVTVDIREPDRPRVARYELIRDEMARLTSDGQRALLSGRSGLTIMDVVHVGGPRRLGHMTFTDPIGATALNGTTAFLGDDSGTLMAVGLGESFEPTPFVSSELPFVNRIHADSYVTEIERMDDLIVVATDGSGLAIVRQTGPGAPTPAPTPLAARAYLPATLTGAWLRPRTGQLTPVGDWPTAANGIAAIGDTVLALHVERMPGGSGELARLVALDMSDPGNVRERGRSEDLDDPREGYAAASVAISGHLAYVTFGSGDVWVLDVRDVAQPRLVGHVNLDTEWRSLQVSGRRLYLYGVGGVRICDLSNPLAPRPIGDIRPPDGMVSAQATGLAVNGDLALVTYLSYGEDDPGLVAMDIHDPAHPRQLGTALAGSAAAAVVSDGQLAYVAPSMRQQFQPLLSGGIVVLDVRDPAHIREVGHRLDRGLREVCELAFVGDGILVGAAETGTYLWDVTQPDLPRELSAAHGRTATCGVGSALAMSGDREYVTGLSALGAGISGLRLAVSGR